MSCFCSPRSHTIYLIHYPTFPRNFTTFSLIVCPVLVLVVISFILLLLRLTDSFVVVIIGDCVLLSMVKLLLKSLDVASDH